MLSSITFVFLSLKTLKFKVKRVVGLSNHSTSNSDLCFQRGDIGQLHKDAHFKTETYYKLQIINVHTIVP